MKNTNKDDEASHEDNAPEPKDEHSSTENSEDSSSEDEHDSTEENLETEDEETEDEVSEVQLQPKEIEEDYLEEEVDETDYKKRYGDSTKEYQKLKEETKDHASAIENLEKLSVLNPKIVEEIEAARKLAGNEPDVTGNVTNDVQRQVDAALEPVKKVAQDLHDKEKLNKVKVLTAFEKKNQLFAPKATKEQKQQIRQRIGKVANALVETGMDYKDAVDRAYLTINPKAAIQKGKDEAYLESLDEEQAGFSSQSSTEGRKPTKTKHSKAELAIGDKMGVGKAMREGSRI